MQIFFIPSRSDYKKQYTGENQILPVTDSQ